jgi:ATP-dependent RNA helicase DDX46/PRP5
MAARRSNYSRSDYDERGGGRHSAPRVDDRRDRDRERDRDRVRNRESERDSYRNDRRGDRRDGRYREDRDHDRDHRRSDDRRFDDRRDRDRNRDSYRRRSRSPPRRERSRDGYRDRRYPREDHYDGRDSRDVHSRRRSDGRLRNSNSATPGADVRPVSRSSNLSREDRKREEEKQKQDAEKAKREKLEQWKKREIEKRLAKQQNDSPAGGPSPAATAPTPPALAASVPSTNIKKEVVQSKAPVKQASEKKGKQTKEFKLDHSAAARPAQFKAAAKSSGTAVGSKCSSLTTKRSLLTQAGRLNGQSSKTGGNVGAFGLKTKSTADDAAPTENALLDDEENTGKRALQALPDFTLLDGEEVDADANEVEEVDDAISNIGSDDEAIQAHLEKRRAELANEDTEMEEAPKADEPGEMYIDDAADAPEDDIDPLDAYMADLSDTKPSRQAVQAQTMFSDDNEPDATAVDGQDLFALTSIKKKKKTEIPKVDHAKVEYQFFRRDFYTEPSEVSQMTSEEVADLRLELDGISVKPDDVPRPIVKWAQMGLLQQTMDVFTGLGYKKPTPIQAQAIPVAESGRNLIGVAKTGSGKTLAFGIPMIRHILDQRSLKASEGPIGLILAPTRELAVQIGAELKPFLKASNLHIACAYGGSPISDQIGMIKRGGIHVLVATPGRLIELLASNGGRVLNFKRVTYVVLDEADRMFDMGFEPQVLKILDSVRPDRQAILFSATFPKSMAALARRALTEYVEITVGGRSIVAPEVDQVLKLVPASFDAKFEELINDINTLFQQDENAQVLIFVERQETAEDLLNKVIKAKYVVNSIHGAKDQNDRTDAINDFKRGILPLLIATSVAARGLDVPNLAMVYNFDCPTHLEDYVHRCGRTGRAGNKGKAITLLETPGQERFAMYIAKALKQSGKDVPDQVQKMAADFDKKIKSGEEKWYAPGFGGKGLDKLDAARAVEKRLQKRTLRIEGVEDVSDDEPELPVLPKTAETGAANQKKTVKDDIPSYMKILETGVVVGKSERAAAGPSKPMTAKERAMAAATKVDGRLSKKGMIHHGQPIDNKGPDAGLFHATVEINDFPQEARWAVTNRTNIVKLLDLTGVSITTKGTYFEPGKIPAEGEQKLYILVEGDTENSVTTAMSGLHGYLSDGIKLHQEKAATRGPLGRYKID